jgi:pimeloyl-ACP methyl ester carboxylesterase
MPSVKLSNGVALEYDVKGTGAPIVLLPGLGNRRFVWAEVVLALADTHRVYSCDLRGYGAPWQGSGFGLKDLAEDVALFLRELDIADAIVMGHSQGGFVALELVLAYPALVRSLVLLASASYTDEYGRMLLRQWRGLAAKDDLQLLIDELFLWNFSWRFCTERTREMRMLKAMIRKAAFDPDAFALHTVACETHETRPRLPAIRVPTLLLGGDLDIVMPGIHNQILASLIPDSELVTLTNVGHNLLAEAPDVVLTWIRGFLDRLPGTSQQRSEGDAA